MENAYMKQKGTYTIDGDQLTVMLEAWSEPSTYTFSVDGDSPTQNENSGYGTAAFLRKNKPHKKQYLSFAASSPIKTVITSSAQRNNRNKRLQVCTPVFLPELHEISW